MAALLKDHELMAWSLGIEALPLFMSGRAAEAIERGEAAVSLARMMQDRPLNLQMTVSFSHVLVAAGRLDRTVELSEPALAEAREQRWTGLSGPCVALRQSVPLSRKGE
jgi:hypothetical protein